MAPRLACARRAVFSSDSCRSAAIPFLQKVRSAETAHYSYIADQKCWARVIPWRDLRQFGLDDVLDTETKTGIKARIRRQKLTCLKQQFTSTLSITHLEDQ
jgi:hypothetical protein